MFLTTIQGIIRYFIMFSAMNKEEITSSTRELESQENWRKSAQFAS
jgi:hypothetical protein